MPCYYFDIQDDLELCRDVDGEDFADDSAARTAAVRRLADILSSLEVGPKTKLVIVVVRRMGDVEPFAAVSTRVTSLLNG